VEELLLFSTLPPRHAVLLQHPQACSLITFAADDMTASEAL
jgi:hypothetical protein